MMKLALMIVAAILVGVAVGAGVADLRMRQVPWAGRPVSSPPAAPGVELPDAGEPTPRVAVDREEYDFGTMELGREADHDFIFRNVGRAPLVLRAGPTTCRCTVSEVKNSKLLPGESFKVTVHWKARDVSDEYRQRVQIYTNDPDRPVVALVLTGEVTVALRADPSELDISHVSKDEPASGEVRLLCSRPERLEILDWKLSDPDLARFFQVTLAPLTAADWSDEAHVRSGVLLKVAVKPGLPPGTFRQTILLRTNLKSMPSFSVDVKGTVEGDVTVAGAGWNPTLQVVDFGFVNRRAGAQRQLMLLARGPQAKEVEFKLLRKEPELLQVSLGKTTPIGTGKITQTPLVIQIPSGSPPLNYLGSDQGKLSQITIQTNLPSMPQLRISARFLIQEE
jgi:hypothetical protein